MLAMTELIILELVPHVLHLRPLLGVCEQPVVVRVVWLLQRDAHYGWIPALLGCFGSDGCDCQAFDEHSQPSL